MFRDSRDSSSEKTPFVMTPFSALECFLLCLLFALQNWQAAHGTQRCGQEQTLEAPAQCSAEDASHGRSEVLHNVNIRWGSGVCNAQSAKIRTAPVEMRERATST